MNGTRKGKLSRGKKEKKEKPQVRSVAFTWMELLRKSHPSLDYAVHHPKITDLIIQTSHL
jgi:hypothetical protein